MYDSQASIIFSFSEEKKTLYDINKILTRDSYLNWILSVSSSESLGLSWPSLLVWERQE